MFYSRDHRKQSLQRYVHYYNFIRRHGGGIDYYTPMRNIRVLLQRKPKLSFEQRKYEKRLKPD